jgi:two-component system LytT family response regulator
MKKDLPQSHITYLEADKNYTVVHYQDGTKDMHGYTFKVFEDKLDTPNFRRIHRKYLVNFKYVKHRLESSVMMKSGVELPVSRRKRG